MVPEGESQGRHLDTEGGFTRKHDRRARTANSQDPCILDRQRRLPKTLRDHVRSASALSALKKSLVANLSAKRQLSVAKLSAKRIFSLAKRDFLVANGRMAADFSSPVKLLLRKSAPEGDITSTAFQQGLLELRNMPDASGRSPAQIVFGHSLRSTVPAPHTSFATEWSTASDQLDQRAADLRDAALGTYSRSSKPLGPLQLGATVRVQDPQTKLWDKIATIILIGQHRTYRVRLASGRVLWRNRRFLRVVPSAPTSSPA